MIQIHPFSILAASENDMVDLAGKRFAVAVDISTPLSSIVQGTSVVTAAAIAMVSQHDYPALKIHSEGAIVPCTISADMSLREVTAKLITSGYTDCALPILWASEKGITVNMSMIFTNSANPAECLRMYRHVSWIKPIAFAHDVSRPDHREPLVLYGVVGQGVTRGVF
uniref:RNA-binding protein RO60 vWA domain-containing protein n=1 Tax=Oncorhynchus kisutch TaxID=8019 RepID=A0A8C7MFY1_ONCKI